MSVMARGVCRDDLRTLVKISLFSIPFKSPKVFIPNDGTAKSMSEQRAGELACSPQVCAKPDDPILDF